MQNIRRGTAAGGRPRERRAPSIPGTAAPSPRPSRGGSAAERSAAACDAKGAVNRDPVCGFIAGSPYLFRNRSLCTIAWTRLRTPYRPGLRRVEDLLDLLAIGESHRRAGGEDRQLPGQVPRDLPLVLDEQPLELAHVLERPAVGQCAGRVDRQRVMERERLPVQAEALDRRDLLGHRPVALAVAAHHVEALQREARRVHLAVAGRAARVGAVLLELLADRDRAADVRLDGLDRRRRGRRLQSQDSLGDPVAAEHRRGRRAVGGHLEDAGLRHHPAAEAVGRQLHLAESGAGDAADAVMLGQPLVQEREVRIDDVPRRQVGAQEFGEEEPRLLQRRQLQRVVELVIVVERGGRRRVVDLPQVEPVIGERLDEAARLGIVEHPLGLGTQHVRLVQLAAVGQRPQRVVGDRVPQEQGQPRGEGVVVEPARLLVDEHEARRRQDGRVGREHRPREAGALPELIVEQPQEPLHVGLGDRPAIRRSSGTIATAARHPPAAPRIRLHRAPRARRRARVPAAPPPAAGPADGLGPISSGTPVRACSEGTSRNWSNSRS